MAPFRLIFGHLLQERIPGNNVKSVNYCRSAQAIENTGLHKYTKKYKCTILIKVEHFKITI